MRFADVAIRPSRWPGVVLLAGLAACAARGPAASPAPFRAADSRQSLLDQIDSARSLVLQPLASPGTVVSSGGVLNARLTAAPGTYTLGNDTFTANLYNGSYVPPTLVMSPGDRVALTLVDSIAFDPPIPGGTVTNLHYHGFNVTPRRPGDDVLMEIGHGEQFSYAFRLPTWHRPGLYWYHPHPHGHSEPQVLDGMSGAMVVEGLIEGYFPELDGIPELVMLLKDHVVPGDSGAARIKSINGLPLSEIRIRPGETQLWRFGNVGADAYYNLKLVDGELNPQPLLVVARDGNPVVVGGLYADSLLLPPGARAEVVVQGGTTPLYLVSDTVDTGPAGDPNPAKLLARVGNGGTGGPARLLPASASPAQRALADTLAAVLAHAARAPRRDIVFSEDTVKNIFFINDSTYKPGRVDVEVTAPTTEVWTIRNTSEEVHVFHIHQGDFIVTEVNGVAQPITGFVDTVNLPYSDGKTPTTVTIVLPFHNLEALGEFVFHCHILEHEDRGMMQNIVLKPLVVDGAQPARRTGAHRGH